MVIHPTSVFATDPEVLLLPEEESRDMGNVIWTQFQVFSGNQTCFAVDKFTIFFATSLFQPTLSCFIYYISNIHLTRITLL